MANVLRLLPAVLLLLLLLTVAGRVNGQLNGEKPIPCDCSIVEASSVVDRWVTVKCELEREYSDLEDSSFKYELLRERNVLGSIEAQEMIPEVPPNLYNLSVPADYGNYTCHVTLSGNCSGHCRFWLNSTYWWKGPVRRTTPYATSSTTSRSQISPPGLPSAGGAPISSSGPPPLASTTDLETPTSSHSGAGQRVDHSPEKSDETTTTGIGAGVGVSLGVGTVLAIVLLVYCRKRRITRARERSRRPLQTESHSWDEILKWRKRDEKPNPLEDIPRKHIHYVNHDVGKGCFGTVSLAEVWNPQRAKGTEGKRWMLVAVKTLLDHAKSDDARRDFLAEIALMRSIPPHANIITFHGSCTAHEPYLMILEFAALGDLRKYLHGQRMALCPNDYGVRTSPGVGASPRVGTSPGVGAGQEDVDNGAYAMPVEDDGVEQGGDTETVTSRLLSFGLQISRGLEHLANNKIVHRDVAARNILLSDRKVVKISDFGLARHVGEDDVYERTRKGPLPARWMAPESLLYNEFGQSSDVWSFGVLLWEIVTLGSTPYPGLDNATLVNRIKAGGSLTCPPHSAAVVNEVMLSCWKKKPDARPTFAQLRVRLEKLLEDQVEYLYLQQMDENLYCIVDD